MNLRKFLLYLLAFVTGLAAAAAAAADWPQGLSFIGLKDGAWRLYGVWDGAEIKAIPTATEPRTAAFNRSRKVAAYVGADGHIHQVLVATGADRIILAATKDRAYTQPTYDAAGNRLFVVVLKDRSSAETEIHAVDPERGTSKAVTIQPGAQFEPNATRKGWLVYSNVSCTVGCGRIMQEIWRKNLETGEAEQLTLFNALSRQAATDRHGRFLYLSSNRGGNYHIWRVPWSGGASEQLTRGPVTDISPTLDADGTLYFVRHSAAGTRLARLAPNGDPVLLQLPLGIEELRDLEIAP